MGLLGRGLETRLLVNVLQGHLGQSEFAAAVWDLTVNPPKPIVPVVFWQRDFR